VQLFVCVAPPSECSSNVKFGHHTHTMRYVCANFHISTILVSEVAHGE